MFELDFIEKNVNKDKELSDLVNNYSGMNSNELTKQIHSKLTPYLERKYLRGVLIGVCVSYVSYMICEKASQNQYYLTGQLFGFGSAFAGVYSLVNFLKFLEVVFNGDELCKKTKEYSQKVIKKKLGIRK